MYLLNMVALYLLGVLSGILIYTKNPLHLLTSFLFGAYFSYLKSKIEENK
jgi:hypothetical protein